MVEAVRVYYGAAGGIATRSFTADLVAGNWKWAPGQPGGTLEHVHRVEVFRAGATVPCLVLNADDDKKSQVVFDGVRLSMILRLLTPAFADGGAFAGHDKGRFEFIAELAPQIFRDGQPLWKSFTAANVPAPLAAPATLDALVSTRGVKPLGTQDVARNALFEQLIFWDRGVDPANHMVALLLRSVEIDKTKCYLIGFSPVWRFSATLTLAGHELTGSQTWLEWIQPAEDVVAWQPPAVTPAQRAWLLWAHRIEGLHVLWNQWVYDRYTSALSMVAAGEDATFTPQFTGADAAAWSLCFRFDFQDPNSTRDTARLLLSVEPFVTDTAVVALRLQGLALIDDRQDRFCYTGPMADADASSAEDDALELHQGWPHQSEQQGFPADEVTRLRVRVRGAVSSAAAGQLRRTRFGALDLSVAPGGSLSLDAVAYVAGARLGATAGIGLLSLQTRVFEAELSDVVPGAEDPLPDTTRTALDSQARTSTSEQTIRDLLRPPVALVIPLGGAVSAPAILEAQEQVSPTASRSMVLRLRRHRNATTTDRSVVYLGTEPFLLAKLSVPALVQPPGDSDEIANWSLSEQEGRKWELATASQGFDLMLPTPSVGEAMEKSLDQPVIGDNLPIDFRFSAPAQLRLGSTWFSQGYAEAPWNLSRVLGYPGQRSPGASIDRLAFELVYGITTVVDASKVPTRLSLAEIASRLGAMAAPLERVLLEGKGFQDSRRDIFFAHRMAWVQMLRVFRSRLAVLEVYAPGEKSSNADGSGPNALKVLEGVTAYLREGRYALTDASLAAADPNAGVDIRYPIAASRRPQATRFYDDGLAGGFAWPFESHSVFQGLLRDPVSNEASVSGLKFSALGAWGDQRASFDNKRTKIISTTAMGRLSRITVERVGRIGVFWNRSKHVIVYERTVLPTRQFSLSQRPLHGRAVLRKVAEYVEVLEAERRFPEFGAVPQSRGFVEAIQFVTRRILVDSRWGTDGPDGLEIPLWDPQQDPRIYPRPTVFLATSGDKQGGSDRVPREISEPDRLVFFSATAADLDDRTDLWPAYAGVDYDNHPMPQPEPGDAMDPIDGDALLPDVLADLPGWRRFTWPLEAASSTTNLVAERTENGALKAALSHVSMMRSAPARVGGAMADAMTVVNGTRALLAQLQQNAAVARSAGLTPDELKSRLLKELASTRAAVGAVQGDAAATSNVLNEQLSTADPQADAARRTAGQLRDGLQRQTEAGAKRIADWQRWVGDELGAVTTALSGAQVKDLTETWSATLSATLLPLTSGFETLSRSLDALARQATDRYQSALELFDEMFWPVQDGGAGASLVLELLEAARGEARDTLSVLADAVPVEVPPMLQGALANLRGNLAGVGRSLETLFDALAAAIEGGGPWVEPDASPFEQLREQVFGDAAEPYASGELTLATPIKLLDVARGALDAAINGLLQADPGIAEFVRGKLAGLVGGTAQDLRNAIDAVCKQAQLDLAKYAAGVLGRTESAATALTQGALGWQENLASLSAPWTRMQQQLDDWRQDLAQQTDDRVEQWLRGFEPGLQNSVAGVESLYGRARSLQEDLGRSPTFQDPSSTLRLIRAVGSGPLLPEMTFNRERIAYFFDDYAAAVRSSPVAALVNRVGDDLKALGLRLPTQSFLDRIIPAELQNFDLSKILPDFSALKNSALFERLKLPAIANDTVRVTQGFDDVNRVPWLKAKVDIPINERSEAFKLGPLSLILPKAQFFARADLQVQGGVLRKTQEARVTADWTLEFGGSPLVTFEDTVLEFSEGGGMRFDIRPDRIRMDAVLEWLTDLMKSYEPEGGSGLQLEMVYDNGRPVGVACTLSAALPPLGAGVFAMSGLQLGAGLTLGADKDSGEFAIGVTFNISRKIKPFTLTIAFLNGGGWVESQARYLTASRRVVSQVSIGIVAGAGVEFALGPCAGSVYVQFGIFVEFSSGGANGQTLSIGIMLLVRGSVVIFSIATVSITLLLQAVYAQDGSLTGYGSLSVSIRVSFFLKLSFSSQVTYQLRGGSGSHAAAHTLAAATGTPLRGTGARALAAANRQSQFFQ